ncbi:pyridoxal 5'-phosphate synthase glutaminase subunit PdxT [Alicyclobacillus tolerans]|uniref:pyridoxal 5'-phosphate synthase glutaminase subunit PdxT n=1 Tax=Alicyclobacillus tolerans TaxID=90970 RepID=UPI001F0101F1|nr:pyridoxal 5'-phosphate synthase glutaminase subunit PdxT [Alicyclobacillus tolerans]MCF8567805.1 pyridoxal 5'-phosphate synthase glutaminase subunit PdxT [Alicyclobacillus tolerans]
MKIGVLALQGAFREHKQKFQELGADAVVIKLQRDLEGIDAIAIPGGESTSIGKLLRQYDLIEPIRERVAQGMPVFGTCAGMIVMANRITGEDVTHLGIMDVEVRRNSFGRQRESFETDLDIPVIGEEPFPAVFIRAPHIEAVGPSVKVLSTYNDRIVAVQQDNLLALSFHPELTGDNRLHAYFLELVKQKSAVGR